MGLNIALQAIKWAKSSRKYDKTRLNGAEWQVGLTLL